MPDTMPWPLRTRLKMRQWMLVVALADEGGLHRAAAALNITQPAASKLLRELEETLGVVLFERMPRGMRATLYGDALIRHARAVLGSIDGAQQELAGLKAGRLGHVAVGAITSPGVRVLPAAVAAIKRTHADLRVSVEIDASPALLDGLAHDRLDVVIARLATGDERLPLRYEPLTGEPVCAVVRPAHPLLAGAAPTLADVQHHAWVLPPAGSVLRHRFDLAFRRANVAPPSNVVETAALLFVTRVLEESDMIAVVADDVARYYAAHGMVAILPLPMDCRMDDFGIVTRADRLLSPAANLMIDALRTASRDAWQPAGNEARDS